MIFKVKIAEFIFPYRDVAVRLSPRSWIIFFGGTILAGLVHRYTAFAGNWQLAFIIPGILAFILSLLDDRRIIQLHFPWVTVIVCAWVALFAVINFIRVPKEWTDESLFTEVAVTGILEGTNPYERTYRGTLVDSWLGSSDERSVHPNVDNFVYFPGHLVLTMPIYYGLRIVGLPWYDQRLVYLTAFVVFLIVLWSSLRYSRVREALFLAMILNPFAAFMFYQFNDLLVLSLLGIMGCMLARGRTVFAAVLYGLALVTKQTAILTLPFLLPILWRRTSNHHWLVAGVGLTAAVIAVPFFLWSPTAFVDDTISNFVTSNTFPITGVGVSALFLGAGILRADDQYPFWIWQLLLAVPALIFLTRWAAKSRSLERATLASAFGIAAVWFFSRYFMPAHISSVLILVGMSYALGEVERTWRHHDPVRGGPTHAVH